MAVVVVAVVLGVAALVLVLRKRPRSAPPVGHVTSSASSSGSSRAVSKPTRSVAPARAAPGLTPTRPAGEVAAPFGLVVEADVPGASVFVDREYKGQAPLTVTGVAPGPHRLNVSAEGYDGYAETVEVSGRPQTVAVRLKEVRLDAGMDVVHKHGLGSCRGRLSATPSGLHYAASKPEDAFDVPLSSLDRLEVDYLKKALAVKLRGGRTFNFTEPSGNADALLVFQQTVAKARSRLASAP